jgi:hypothetical protein
VLDVRDTAKRAKYLVNKLDLTVEAALASQLLGLIRAMIAGLNYLAEAGKLGDAPRFHETWPINYAPDAGKGASKWEAAKELYHKLGCGKDAIVARIAGQVNYGNLWTALAIDGVRAALLAKHSAISWVDEKIKNAKWRAPMTYPTCGRAKIQCDYYLCQDGQVIAWPAWAERSKGLPDKLTSDNWTRFLPVVRELVRIYLLQDEKRMRRYLTEALPKESRYELKKWDANIFNNELMGKVKGALKSIASR